MENFLGGLFFMGTEGGGVGSSFEGVHHFLEVGKVLEHRQHRGVVLFESFYCFGKFIHPTRLSPKAVADRPPIPPPHLYSVQDLHNFPPLSPCEK